jgi:hypothetical protein
MKRGCFLFSLAFLFTIYSRGQDSIIKRFPDGRIEEISVMVNGNIVKASAYHLIRVRSTDTIGTIEYSPKYSWDKQTKVIESYWTIDDSDKLEMLFFKQCPNYTLKQHRGDGPLFFIETYKNKIRDGKCSSYDETGKLIVEGQYTNRKKTGVWKYYNEKGNTECVIMINGSDNDYGISINYTIAPTLIAIILTLFSGIFISRRYGYKTFYINFCRGVLIFCIILLFIARYIGQIVKYPLFLWLIVIFILSMVNFALDEKSKIKPGTSAIYAFLAFLMGVFYYVIFDLSEMANAASAAVLF